jgi:hypothetical protein
MVQSPLVKKGCSKQGYIEVCRNGKGFFWSDGQHTFTIMNAHTSMMDGGWPDGKEKGKRLPMTVLAPRLNWNYTEQHLLEM